jgi:ATP-dependent protease ClpP protease subunit
MTKRTVLMIHNPIEMVSAEGAPLTTQDIRDLSNDLSASSEAMLEHNIHRMKVSKEYVAAKIAYNKWFFTWEEALKVGAVDEVLPVPSTSNPTQSKEILKSIAHQLINH